MNTKKVLAVSLFALGAISVANAEKCTSAANGFYIAAKVSVKATKIEDTITTKSQKLTGTKIWSTIAEGTADYNAEEKKTLEDWDKAMKVINDYTSSICYNRPLELLSDEGKGLFSLKVLRELTGIPALAHGSSIIGNVADTKANKDKTVEALQKQLGVLFAALKTVGVEAVVNGGGEFKITTTDAANPEVSWPRVQLKIVKTGKTVDYIPARPAAQIAAGAGGAADGAAATTVGGLIYQLFFSDLTNIQDINIIDDVNDQYEALKLPAIVKTPSTAAEISAEDAIKADAKNKVDSAIGEATRSISSSKNQFGFGAALGYQFASGSFYVGLEGGGEFNLQEVEVSKVSTDGKKVYDVAGYSVEYGSQLAASSLGLKLQEKGAFFGGLSVGVTAGNWMFGPVFSVTYTNYELTVTGNEQSAKDYIVTYADKDATHLSPHVVDAKVTKEGSEGTVEQKKSEGKVGFDIGIAAKVMLTKNVFVGLRCTFSPKKEVEFKDFSGYKTDALHDVYAAGSSHKLAIEEVKGTLEFGFKF